MYCPSCGKQIADDSNFCRHCGAAQEAVDPETAAVSKPVASASPAAPSVETPATGNFHWVGWLLGGVLLLFAIIALTSGHDGRPADAPSENIVVDNSIDAMMANDVMASDTAVADAPKEIWAHSEDVDKVRGSTSYYATTTSTNTIHQDPPYDSDTSMTLTVRRARAYGTDVILSISSGQMMCPSYEGCSGTVSFDGGAPERISFAGPADHSNDTIFVENPEGFIAKLKRAKKLVVEKTLYEAGNPQFEFDVAGLKWDR